MNKFKHGNWNNKYYPIENLLFTKALLNDYIKRFWIDTFKNLDDNLHILLLVRIRRENGEFATIGHLQRLNKNDNEYLLEYLLNIIELKTGGYIDMPITALVFSYGIREGLAPIKSTFNSDIKYLTYYHYKLPITFDPLKYGILMYTIENKYFIQINPKNMTIIEVKDKNK